MADSSDAARQLLAAFAADGSDASAVPSLRSGAGSRGTSRFSGGVVNVSSVDDVASILSSPQFGGTNFVEIDQSPNFQSAMAPICMLWTSVEMLERMCMGRIGSKGEKACTREKINGEACGTVAHAQKAAYLEDTIYFWDAVRNQVYLKSHLGFSVPFADSLYELRYEELTHVQVRELMDVIRRGEIGSAEELIMTKERMTNPEAGISFTPRKKPRFSGSTTGDSFVELDAMDAIEELPAEDPLQGETLLKSHMVRNWKVIVDTLEALKTSVLRSKRGEEEISRLGDDIDNLNAAGRRLMSLVGSPAEGLKFDLFKITEGHEESLLRLEIALEDLKRACPPRAEWTDVKAAVEQAKKLAQELEAWKREVEEVAKGGANGATATGGARGPTASVDGTSVSLQQVADLVIKRIWPALNDVWGLYEVATVGPGGGSVTAGTPRSNPGAHLLNRIARVEQAGGVADLEERVSRLENAVPPARGATAPPSQSTGGSGLGHGLDDIFGMGVGGGASNVAKAPAWTAAGVVGSMEEERFQALVSKVTDMESRLGAITVDCGGQRFRNIEGCAEIVTLHVPGQTYAYFYDMMSLLQRAWGDAHVPVGRHMDDLYARKRAGLPGIGEASIAASMVTVLPTCLGEDPTKKADPSAALSAVPTHKHWTASGGQAGRKVAISRALHRTNGSLMVQFSDVFRGNLMGTSVVNDIYLKARAHWVAFEQMLDGFYMEFCAFGPEKEAWTLVCLIGKTVFEVLHDVRGAAADLSDCTTATQRAARVLWVTLQATRVMDEFMASEFRNHPRVAAVIVLHLLENRVPKDDFDKLKTQCDQMQVQLDTAIGQMNSKLNTTVKAGDGNGRGTCGLVVGSSFAWVWGARSLGFEPAVVLTKDEAPNFIGPLVFSMHPLATVSPLQGLTLKRPKETVWFVEGFIPQALREAMVQGTVEQVYATAGRGRREEYGGFWSEARALHADVGGVTDSTGRCYLWSKTENPLEVTVPKLPRRDVYSVTSDVVAGAAAAAPSPVRLLHPEVCELRPGCFHGGGLVPLKARRPLFRLRCVFTRTRWCDRVLKGSELASAHDIPQDVVGFAERLGIEKRLLCCRPSKAVEHCARSLMAAQLAIGEAASVRGKVDCAGGAENMLELGTTAPVVVVEGSAARTSDGGKAKEVVLETVSAGAKDETGPGSLDLGPRSELSGLGHEPELLGLGTGPRPGGLGCKEAMAVVPDLDPCDNNDVEAGDRNSKAVKSDDAAVPTWLWDDRIIGHLWKGQDYTFQQKGRAVLALSVLRDKLFLPRSFRLGAWRSFRQYLADKRSATAEMGPLSAKRRFPHQSGRDIVVLVSGHEGGAGEQYVWSPGGMKGYQAWWKEHWTGVEDDRLPGLDAIERAAGADWWEWGAGSAPFFWRWPAFYQKTIRDGLKVWMKSKPLAYTKPQRREPDDDTRAKVTEKLGKVRERGYIAPGKVTSLTDFFSVPKGSDDIRMVYNGTSSGLNDCLWVPSFTLPTVNSTLRQIFPHSHMADTDLGEMFLCFMLHESLRELAGVDVTHYQKDSEDNLLQRWERWVRCAMGLKPSPYQTTQAMHFAEDVIRGNRRDPGNIFAWDVVMMNLPGSEDYDPSLPWVWKRRLDGLPACDFWFYVDDNRTVGNSKDEAWRAASRVASICNYLGVQDAARKRREASDVPGAWAGTMTSTDGDKVSVSCQQEKWDKARSQVEEMTAALQGARDGMMDRKRMESVRGFLLYVTRTYPSTVPYLKGFHNTLDGWRANRDEEGWRITATAEDWLPEDGVVTMDGDQAPPSKVRAVPRLKEDLRALGLLFGAVVAPLRTVRSRVRIEVYYGFGDASQDGFGFNVEKAGSAVVRFRYGQWCDEVSEASSNYRELRNLVDRIAEMVEEGRLLGAELFIFTDNTTAEAVFYKGNSSSRSLFELVLRLRRLEMDSGMVLHVVHVAGTRMIAEGADGASRGDTGMGAMVSGRIIDHVPLNESCLARSPAVEAWLNKSWDSERGVLKFLEPSDWFERDFEATGSYVWAPAPAAGDVAVEQMARVNDLEVEEESWRAQRFGIRAGPRGRQGPGNLEGLLSWKTWVANCASCTKPIRKGGGVFCGNFCSRRGHWNPCRKAWCGSCYGVPVDSPYPIKLAEDDEGFDQTLAGDERRFKMARDGDFLMAPFQCELCHFRNIQRRDPRPALAKDRLLLGCIRRASLDAFWSREPSTVRANLLGARRMEEIGATLGLDAVLPNLGPFPLEDTFGMKAAVCMLLRSLDPGKTAELIQFSTVRYLRSVYTNVYHASKEHVDGLAVMAHQTTKVYSTNCPTYGYWFERFVKGMHKRMGEEVRSDFALSVEVLHKSLGYLDRQYLLADTQEKRRDVAEIALFFVLTFCIALRGEEVVKLDVAGLLRYFQAGKLHAQHPHVMVPLVGRFKGETGERWHLIPMVWRTRSGIEAGLWTERMVASLLERGIVNGFVYRTPRGKQAKASTLEPRFYEVLNWVRARYPGIFPPNVDVENDYGLGRSGRRGSNTEAQNQGVSGTVIETICRWRKVERAQGRAPNLGMREHYTEVSLALDANLAYSRPL